MTTTQVVTDCCGRLLDAAEVLVNDVHYIEMCPACLSGEGEHESHVTCKGECPGRGWKYTRETTDAMEARELTISAYPTLYAALLRQSQEIEDEG